MAHQPGQLVTDTLKLVRLLGKGGMGSVWVADHLTLECQVAVKLVSAAFVGEEQMVARFTREATAAAQMRHPHVVQILDHGITLDGVPFIAMELLDGEDLAKRIGRTGRVGLSEMTTILRHTGKALGKAHAAGIVHRDIKPDNIFLLDLDGELFVKVLDFGIAKQLGGDGRAITGTGAMLGTPYYMSPEQAAISSSVDHRCDLWALGVVAYQALTGKLPFEADTVGGVLLAIARGTFPPVTMRDPDLPPALNAWFARALAVKREDRFSSAKEMVEAWEIAVDAPRDSLARSFPALSTPSPVITGEQTVASTPSGARITGSEATIAASIPPAAPTPAPISRTNPEIRVASQAAAPVRRPWVWAGSAAIVAVAATALVFTMRSNTTSTPATSEAPPGGKTSASLPASVEPLTTAAVSASAVAASSVSAAPSARPAPVSSIRKPATTPHTPPAGTPRENYGF
jgi:eukaryotic-like serine/threonine-protein kinase